MTDQTSLLQGTVRSLFDYCSGCDLPVKDVAAAVSKKLGRTYVYTRASIKEAVETIFPGVIHTSKIAGNQRNGKDTRSSMYLLTLLYHFYAFDMHLLCLLWCVVANENGATVSPYFGDISCLSFAERLTSTLLIIIICHFLHV